MPKSSESRAASLQLCSEMNELLNGHHCDAIMDALLSAIVTVIVEYCPEENRAEMAAKFGATLYWYVTEKSGEPRTLQ